MRARQIQPSIACIERIRRTKHKGSPETHKRDSGRTHLLVMEVIVRLQDRALCASITCITGTYAEPEERVIFDHRHNAAMRYVAPRVLRPSPDSSSLALPDDDTRPCGHQVRHMGLPSQHQSQTREEPFVRRDRQEVTARSAMVAELGD